MNLEQAAGALLGNINTPSALLFSDLSPVGDMEEKGSPDLGNTSVLTFIREHGINYKKKAA